MKVSAWSTVVCVSFATAPAPDPSSHRFAHFHVDLRRAADHAVDPSVAAQHLDTEHRRLEQRFGYDLTCA
jgi:hypothetical protein